MATTAIWPGARDGRANGDCASRARGWVMTLMRAVRFTAARKRASHFPGASWPVGFSSTSTAPAASAS